MSKINSASFQFGRDLYVHHNTSYVHHNTASFQFGRDLYVHHNTFYVHHNTSTHQQQQQHTTTTNNEIPQPMNNNKILLLNIQLCTSFVRLYERGYVEHTLVCVVRSTELFLE
jgi:hypothetical protein